MNITNCILVQEEWAPLAVPHVISSIELCWRSFLRNVWLYKSKSYPVIMSQYVTYMLHIVRETYCLDRAKFTKNISCFETCGSPTPQDNETQDGGDTASGGNTDSADNPEKVGEVLSRHNSQAAELWILKSYRFYIVKKESENHAWWNWWIFHSHLTSLARLECWNGISKTDLPSLKNPSHSQQFEMVSLVDAEYMDKYFTTWTNISIHEQLLFVEKIQSIICIGFLGRKKYQNLICVGMITDRDQQWRFRTSETLDLFYGIGIIPFGLCTVWDVRGLPPWKVVLEASFESFFVYSRNSNGNGKIKLYSEGLYLLFLW